MRILRPFHVAVILCSSGCASISSTVLNRSDSDLFFGNSNGKPEYDNQARPFKGVPITMRVPTHLDLVVKEQLLLRVNKDGQLKRMNTSARHLVVEPVVIYTDKVFTVDVKRSAAGTLDYTFGFGDKTTTADNSQYLKTFHSKIQDNTLKDMASAIDTVVAAIKTSTQGSEKPAETPDNVQVFTEFRTVAWKRFDIDAVDFESQVTCFIGEHLNCCNTCQCNSAVNHPNTAGTINCKAESDTESVPTFAPPPAADPMSAQFDPATAGFRGYGALPSPGRIRAAR